MTTAPAAPEPRELSPWDALAAAKTADAFCRAWLGILGLQIPGLRAAAVLVEDGASHSYVPIAVWPKASPDLARLSGVVELALQKGKPVIQPVAGSQTLELAYPVLTGSVVQALVAVEVQAAPSEAAALMRQVHWSSAWLANLFTGRDLEQAERSAEQTASVLDILAVALRYDTLRQALFEVTNALSVRFGGARVAIGLAEDARVQLAALSEAAHFDRNLPLAKAYVAAMEEALDAGHALQRRPQGTPESAAEPSPPFHERLCAQSGAKAALTCPLPLNGRIVALITLDRREAEAFTDHDLAWLEAFGALAAPVLIQRREAERRSWQRLLREGRGLLDRLFGPGHLIWKTAAVLLTVTTLALALVQITYRVTAKTVIEGEVQRVVAAPFSGFILQARARAGDTVRAGQALAGLDDRELRMEEARWISERDQYSGKLREAVATRNLTDVQVIGAQLQQAQAQLALATDKIARSVLRAPFDGLVVSGDLSQQIGAPVEPGKELFTIAPLQSYRVILQVDERDIRQIRPGQHGKLVMIGIAGEPIPLTVSKVTPVATNQDGQNYFRVEAVLPRAPVRLRPGMEGVGKIETDRRALGWVLLHPLTDWLSLAAWKWLP